MIWSQSVQNSAQESCFISDVYFCLFLSLAFLSGRRRCDNPRCYLKTCLTGCFMRGILFTSLLLWNKWIFSLQRQCVWSNQLQRPRGEARQPRSYLPLQKKWCKGDRLAWSDSAGVPLSVLFKTECAQLWQACLLFTLGTQPPRFKEVQTSLSRETTWRSPWEQKLRPPRQPTASINCQPCKEMRKSQGKNEKEYNFETANKEKRKKIQKWGNLAESINMVER